MPNSFRKMDDVDSKASVASVPKDSTPSQESLGDESSSEKASSKEASQVDPFRDEPFRDERPAADGFPEKVKPDSDSWVGTPYRAPSSPSTRTPHMYDLRQRIPIAVLIAGIGLAIALLMSGCQTLQEVANLRNVDFNLDRVSDVRLAGVSLAEVRSVNDIGVTDMLRIGAAYSDGVLPLQFTTVVEARNPSENRENARLTEMDWRLFLNDRETIAGRFDREVVIPPGEPTDIPISMELDLIEFFDGSRRDIIDLALALAGDSESTNIKLRARPTIQTSFGRMRYPNEILIVNETVDKSAVQ